MTPNSYMIDTYFKNILVKVEVTIKNKDDGLAKFGTGKYFTKFYANSVFGKSLSLKAVETNHNVSHAARTLCVQSFIVHSIF